MVSIESVEVRCFCGEPFSGASWVEAHAKRLLHILSAHPEETQVSAATNAAPGRKDDRGKPRFSLVPSRALDAVVRVLELGAAKYGVGNWQQVPDARRRYFDAAMRHLRIWWTGEEMDDESGESHLAHAICCLLFLEEMDVTTAQASLDADQYEDLDARIDQLHAEVKRAERAGQMDAARAALVAMTELCRVRARRLSQQQP